MEDHWRARAKGLISIRQIIQHWSIDQNNVKHANHDYDEGDEIEFPRGAVNRIAVEKKRSTAEDIRTKLFAARTAIDIQPRLLERTREKITEKSSTGRVRFTITRFTINVQILNVLNFLSSIVLISRVSMKTHLVFYLYVLLKFMSIYLTRYATFIHSYILGFSYSNYYAALFLGLYRGKYMHYSRYDNKWKNHYTDIFMSEIRGKEKKPVNKQGWVLPLKEICKKVAISAKYFTDNRTITLEKARSYVLRQRLSINYEPSVWLSELDPHSTRNPVLLSFLSKNFDPHALQSRIALYNENIYSDRDRVRVAGKYYNNIQLGKRMFGPSKKQKFIRTITGGMERRFEILDNQVNHLPFTHKVSDEYPEKCRNIRVHCRDSSRVVLHYPPGTSNDFIHANRIVGGPLFNEFIITQAPLDDTIGTLF
uniref:Tyrosine-protein phosphatase domain-containing protein n=1 Tax=Heterorhabditis bacteriophora TaxID=37862 RepID=A0A1I7X611_HETBA